MIRHMKPGDRGCINCSFFRPRTEKGKLCGAHVLQAEKRCGPEHWHWCPKGAIFVWNERPA